MRVLNMCTSVWSLLCSARAYIMILVCVFRNQSTVCCDLLRFIISLCLELQVRLQNKDCCKLQDEMDLNFCITTQGVHSHYITSYKCFDIHSHSHYCTLHFPVLAELFLQIKLFTCLRKNFAWPKSRNLWQKTKKIYKLKMTLKQLVGFSLN